MKLFPRSILFFTVITAFAPFAPAATLYFDGGAASGTTAGTGTNGGTGDFNDPLNWSTVPPNTLQTTGNQTVPGVGDIAVVQADLNDGAVRNDGITTTTNLTPVTITELTASNTVQGFIVSNRFINTGGGIVNFTNTGQVLTINGTGNSNGDFVVDGGATLNYSGGTLAVTNGLTIVGDEQFLGVGRNTEGGDGTFNIQTGIFTFDAANTSTQMIVGYSQFGGFGGNATGTVTQGVANTALSSTVVLGSSLVIGFDSGVGTWTLLNSSVLKTPQAGGLASSYLIALGANGGSNNIFFQAGTGSTGTLNINDTSIFDVGTSGSGVLTQLQLGTTAAGASNPVTHGGTGTINQNGAGSVVNFAGTNTFISLGTISGDSISATAGGTGIYNLNGGILNIGLVAGDNVVFTLGDFQGGNGILNQAAGTTLNVASGSTFTVGTGVGLTAASGLYKMSGGTANFSTAINLGASGELDLNGGTLNIASNDVAGKGIRGTGTLNFGGGTLNLTSGAVFTDSFAGGKLTNGTVSTINAATGSFTSVVINQNLVDSSVNGAGGGIILMGTDGLNGTTNTVFTLAGTNTYTGPTTIAGGTLTLGVLKIGNIQNTSALNITSVVNPIAFGGTSVGTVNLTLADHGLGFVGALGGDGNLNLDFTTAGDTFAIKNGSNFTGNIKIDKSGATAGNLQVYNGTFGNISAGAGDTTSTVTIGGLLPININNNFAAPTSGTVNIVNATYAGLTTINTGFTLNITGAGGLTGSVTNFGNLNTPSIGGDVTNNTGNILVTGATGIVGNVGSAGTPNTGTITTPFVGGNLFNGDAVTGAGTFTTSSALGATSVAGNVTNNGTLVSTTPLGAVGTSTFKIGGTFDQTATGVFNVRVLGLTSDLYTVTGAANLAGSVNVVGSTAVGTQTLTILTDAAGATNNGLTATGATALFSATILTPANGATANAVTIQTNQIAIAAFIAPFGASTNQLAVANAIDATSGNILKTIFNTVPAGPGASSTILNLTSELTPERLLYARTISFEYATYLAQRMNGFDADLRDGYQGLDTNAISVIAPGFQSGLGRSLGSMLAYNDPGFHSSAPNGVNYYPGESGRSSASPSESTAEPTFDSSSQVISDSPNPYLANSKPGSSETPRMNEFIGGDVILADLNQNQTTPKASYVAGGATAGVSFRVTNHFAAGVLFDYNHTDAKIDEMGSKTKVDSYSPGVFATYFDHGFYANGLFSFGYNKYDNTLNSTFPGVGNTTAKSSPTGQQYITDLDLGYDFHPSKNWIVGPTLGVTYTHLNIDAFQETGAAASASDLSVDKQSLDSLRSRFGGHLTYQTNTGDVLLQPSLFAMWQHEYLDDSTTINSTLTDIGSNSFAFQTAAPSKDSALVGVGLTASLNNSMALYLNYMADVGASDYFSQSVIGGFKARF